MIQLRMILSQVTIIQKWNSGVFLKRFPSQKPNMFKNCDPPADMVFDARRPQPTNKNLRPGRVVSGHKTAAVVLRLKKVPHRNVFGFPLWTMTAEANSHKKCIFCKSMQIPKCTIYTYAKIYCNRTKHGPQALDIEGLNFTSQTHRIPRTLYVPTFITKINHPCR